MTMTPLKSALVIGLVIGLAWTVTAQTPVEAVQAKLVSIQTEAQEVLDRNAALKPRFRLPSWVPEAMTRIIGHASDALVELQRVVITGSGVSTEYFVDYGRTSNGDGSEANPWKERNDINWTSVSTALASGPVTIYFSSRSTWTASVLVTIAADTTLNAAATRRLTLDGKSKYNLTASGTAVWSVETVPGNRAYFDNPSGTTGGTIVIRENTNQFITVRGFTIDDAGQSGVNLGESNPSINIHDIIIDDVYVTDNARTGETYGVSGVFLETGCYNIEIRNSTFIGATRETIYLGHYNYLPSTFTGVIIENNTIINPGPATSPGEGDMDLKPPVFGAIVRNNTIYTNTANRHVLAGIVVQGSDAQIYNNQLYALQHVTGTDGGSGIQINADGADIPVTSITRASTTATVTTQDAHTLTTGDTMQMVGANETDYNITATVTVTGTTTFTYTVAGSPTTPATPGGDGIRALVGKKIENTLVYNNLIYSNDQAGIKVFANRQSVTGLKILNNTIVGNNVEPGAGTGGGLLAGASSPQSITISELHNNIFSSNGGSGVYEIDTSSNVTISAANNNLIYHPAGGNFLRYQGVNKSFAQWQSLGFDAAGVNADPNLDVSYVPNAGSVVIGAGSVQTEFTTDKVGTVRGAAWDIGALEKP